MNNHAGAIYAMMNSLSTLARNSEPGEHTKLKVGTINSMPGAGLLHTMTQAAKAFGVEMVEVRMPELEYHPGALDTLVNVPVEEALATGKPVLICLDEAGTAAPGVIEAAMRNITSRAEGHPCSVLASLGQSRNPEVNAKLAEGAGITSDQILDYSSL